MAGAHIKFESKYIEFDDGGTLAMLERLAAAGGSQEAAFKNIGEYLVQRTEERFDKEIGPGGVPWVELQPETRARKRHSKILTETGRLRGSFNYQVSADELLFGTNVIYAAIHQFGGEHMPARPFLGFDEEDESRIYEIVLDHLIEAAKGEG